MVSFVSDYTTGAHPEVLAKLAETNLEPLPGYGADPYCESAKEKIRAACGLPEAEVFFLTGGTQTNAVVISTMLKDWEGVIAAKTGHVSVHEAGAIEYTGHEVLEVEQADGKIRPETLSAYLAAYYADESHEHMTFPGMVYVSHPTEYGTLYTKAELEGIAAVCREYGLRLFLDGARLPSGHRPAVRRVLHRRDQGRRPVRRGGGLHEGEYARPFPDLGEKAGRAAGEGTAPGGPV